MLEYDGDSSIWDFYESRNPVVIPTNIGWKANGANAMGAGMAKEAAKRCIELPMWYGKICKEHGADTDVCYYEEGNLFLFPTKPFNKDKPYLSWKANSDLALIKKSAIQLEKLYEKITSAGRYMPKVGLPLVGCGAGNLKREDVMPILQYYLNDNFLLFEPSEQ